MENPDFRFDPSDHSYWLGSRRLLGTTEVLSRCGLISDFSKNPEAAERGTIVHECLELLVQNKLDWKTVDERILGYVLSGQKLLEHTQWIARAVETQKYDERLGIAGQFDVSFESGHLIDWKTGGPAAWHAAQLGCYWHLNGKKDKCLNVYLQADGSIARVKQLTSALVGFNDFLACLNFLRLKERYGNSSNRD